jgi:hypothetical protein
MLIHTELIHPIHELIVLRILLHSAYGAICFPIHISTAIITALISYIYIQNIYS